MTPSELWDHINPRHPSDSNRGWDFRRDEPKQGSLRWVFAVLAGVLIVAALIAWWL